MASTTRASSVAGFAPTTADALADVTIVAAHSGESVFFRDLWDQNEGVAVVALMRHFGCPCSWDLASDLRDSKSKFDQAGAKVIVVGVGSADNARVFAERDEFIISVKEKKARPALEKTFPQRFRSMKSTYCKQFLNDVDSVDAPIARCPKGVDTNHWPNFVTHEMIPEVKARNKRNQLNRQQNTVGHTLGRSTYAQRSYMLEKENPRNKIKRSECWEKGHEKSDGTVLESAKELYKPVTEAEEKRLESNDDDGLGSDELVEVFGPDKKD